MRNKGDISKLEEHGAVGDVPMACWPCGHRFVFRVWPAVGDADEIDAELRALLRGLAQRSSRMGVPVYCLWETEPDMDDPRAFHRCEVWRARDRRLLGTAGNCGEVIGLILGDHCCPAGSPRPPNLEGALHDEAP